MLIARCLCLLLWERCADGVWLDGNVTLSYAESPRDEDICGGVFVFNWLFYKEKKKRKIVFLNKTFLFSIFIFTGGLLIDEGLGDDCFFSWFAIDGCSGGLFELAMGEPLAVDIGVWRVKKFIRVCAL